MTSKEKAVNARLIRTYNITLDEYNKQLARQNNCCAICHRKPKKNRLAVDHNHSVERAKIEVSFCDITDKKLTVRQWNASALEVTKQVVVGLNKKEVIKLMKDILKRQSVRGLLCWVCNKKLLGILERFKVKPQAIINYLKEFDPNNSIIKE